MWTSENRRRYDRSRLRYPSDLTDDEWAYVAPSIPPAKPGGNKRTVDLREVMNGVMYILSTGCQWRALPKDLPPKSTVHDYLVLWSCDGTLDRIHHALYVACRELVALHSDYDSLEERGYARPILARALSVVNIHLMRAPEAFRCRSQAAISRRSHFGSSILRSRHWPRKTPISISTMLSQLACLGV